MEAAAQMFEKQRATWDSMPQPTAGERALLDRYHDQLMGLMKEDDEEEWEERDRGRGGR